MDELLQEFVSSRGVDVRVDAERGVIRGVKLLGLESRNGRRYQPAALREAAALYEGAKVNVNHPKGSPLAARDYQDRLGSIRNVRAAAAGLFGDLHFNPKHTLAEQLAWDARHAPENVGFSHNVEARTSRSAGRSAGSASGPNITLSMRMSPWTIVRLDAANSTSTSGNLPIRATASGGTRSPSLG